MVCCAVSSCVGVGAGVQCVFVARLCLCGVWCVARLGTRGKKCTSKTPPCVMSKRPHIFNMRAVCRCTRRRCERTHGGVLPSPSFLLLSSLSLSLSFSLFLFFLSFFLILLLLLFPLFLSLVKLRSPPVGSAHVCLHIYIYINIYNYHIQYTIHNKHYTIYISVHIPLSREERHRQQVFRCTCRCRCQRRLLSRPLRQLSDM